MTEKVPEISLSDYTHGSPLQKKTFIAEMFEGLKKYGFIILKDHNVPVELLDKAYQLSEQLFNLDETTKRSYISSAGAGQRGYTPFGTEHAKDNPHPDLKEFWHVGQFVKNDPSQELFPENIWPDEIKEFQDTFTTIYKSLEETGKYLLEALSTPLLADPIKFKSMIDNGNSILRLLHYPPLASNVDPNCVRAAAHEDINLITILVAATTSGLQLLNRDNEWLDIETTKNNLIVDAGDMLARITNNVIPSTTHRVVNPKGENTSRYSMPFFIHPHPAVTLTCLDSCKTEGQDFPADISSHEFLLKRLREIGLTK